MPKVVAGLMALIALGASVIAEVDTLTALTRAAVAYVGGSVLTTLWYTAFGSRSVADAPAAEVAQADEKRAAA